MNHRALRSVFGAVTALVALAVAVLIAIRPKLRSSGATPEEQAGSYPGDDLVQSPDPPGTFAITLNATPSEIWPWLVQMGSDRGGFYSWDALDNGGDASAGRVHPEWQDLEEGGRINTVPGRSWFDVVTLDPERTLVLRASIAMGTGRSFDPTKEHPRAYLDGVWGFHLRPLDEQQTRLIVRSVGVTKPGWLGALYDVTFFTPAHWIMQKKQLEELARRVDRTAQPVPVAA